MEIYITLPDTIVIEENSQMLAISKSWAGDYISLETNPYKFSKTTFEISKKDELSSKIYDLFSECISNLISHYENLGYAYKSLKIDKEKRKIEILKNTISNDMTIEEKKDTIIITINNKENNIRNNRVILDKDGDLSYGYYHILQDVYCNLRKIEQEPKARLTKKL